MFGAAGELGDGGVEPGDDLVGRQVAGLLNDLLDALLAELIVFVVGAVVLAWPITIQVVVDRCPSNLGRRTR